MGVAADGEPRLVRPNNTRVSIAPLTLTYGQPPPAVGTQVQTDAAIIVGAWPTDWRTQYSAKSAAWSVPPVVVAGVPGPAFPYALILTPQPTWNAQQSPRIAPQTLTYGEQPARRPFASTLTNTVLSWVQIWGPQRSTVSNAWGPAPPVVVSTPRTIALVSSRSNTWALDGSRTVIALPSSRENTVALSATRTTTSTLPASRGNTIPVEGSE
jgi:hypothetical protein